MKVEYWQNTETFKPIKRVGILIIKDIHQNMLRKEIAKYTIILFFSLIFPNVVLVVYNCDYYLRDYCLCIKAKIDSLRKYMGKKYMKLTDKLNAIPCNMYSCIH